MPFYHRCDSSVDDLAREIICQYAEHDDLAEAKVKIDFVFAFAKTDDDGNPVEVPLKLHGVQCAGIAKKIGIKDRIKGMGDAEITLDGDLWPKMSIERQRALLDHELYHLVVKRDREGVILTDDAKRPVIKIRLHDYEFGWFNIIAMRHGNASFERRQAKQMFDDAGQWFWPEIAEALQKAD